MLTPAEFISYKILIYIDKKTY